MRSNGVAEQYCTGDAPPFEKFKAWAATVPHTLRNPLYHWMHLELKRYFGIDELLNEHTAQSVWDRANEQLATQQLSTQGILETFNVQLIGTTDDPTDELVSHQRIAMTAVPTRVIPTFQPDKALDVHQPDQWNFWVSDLENISNLSIASLSDFLDALKARHDFFHYRGSRMSDHGLERCVARFTSDTEVARIFEKARAGKAASEEEREKFASHLMLCFGRWNAEKGWTMQLHLGAPQQQLAPF
jgi:glucuronate isomerase